jgi:uncharacterized protein (TIGR02996 family)
MPTDLFSPPRPELIALLDAVKDHPDEDTPRLVLADWLDEQDNELDAERAKFIRKDIARKDVRTDEEREEVEKLVSRWLGPVAELASMGSFHYGLPVLWVKGPRFLKPDVPKLLASEAFAFVQLIRFQDAGGPRMEAIAAMPEFCFVPGVFLDPFGSFGTHYAAKVFASPNLTGLRRIEFRGIDPGVAGTESLAKNPALSRLRKLSLHHNKLVDKAVVALAGSPHLTNLTHLDLHDNKIGHKGAEALAASTAFPNLQELDLRENPRLTDNSKQLLRDTFGDRVRLD